MTMPAILAPERWDGELDALEDGEAGGLAVSGGFGGVVAAFVVIVFVLAAFVVVSTYSATIMTN